MNNALQQVRSAFRSNYFRWWVIASIGGSLVLSLMLAGVRVLVDISLLPNDIFRSMFGQIVLPLVSGAGVGLCQWWVLRHKFRRAYGWILVTALGFLLRIFLQIGLVFLAIAIYGIDNPAANAALMPFRIASILCDGFGIGLMQWLFFRGRVRGAAHWILAVILSQLLVRAIQLILLSLPVASWNDSDLQQLLFKIAVTVVNGTVSGCVTGVVLAIFIAQREAANPANEAAP